jgi:hypothetical protein
VESGNLDIRVVPGELAVCRLPAGEPVPGWAWRGEIVSITRTADELSVVCAADALPSGIVHTPGWRALGVVGPLDFGLVGVLASLSTVLAGAGVSIFAVSTHDTDLILVRTHQLEPALAALRDAGYGLV